jgi:hypothetical protein
VPRARPDQVIIHQGRPASPVAACSGTKRTQADQATLNGDDDSPNQSILYIPPASGRVPWRRGR